MIRSVKLPRSQEHIIGCRRRGIHGNWREIVRESFVVSICPETSAFVQSFLSGGERSFLLHGHAQLKTGLQTQDRHLFLFTDVLVIAKAKSSNQFKQKAQVLLCEMWTAGCLEEVCEGTTYPERSFVLGWPTSNCVAVFGRIKEEKEMEEPKTIPLRVYGKGINTFAVTKTLPVSNSDSTNEVIRLALQQFGIIGNVKDYQLWVISKRDNTPYPLIGHEFPFSIQMNHVRQSKEGREGREEERLLYKQCQFILKPRPSDVMQQHQEATDFSQKSFKRRRSLITWAFWRGPAQLSSLSGAPRGCLFGQPLSSVCIENTLPKPVLDMLTFLYHEGCWTRGIFRRPAGARAVRELRDSLDAGELQLPMTRDHVFIIAGVFKEFLRSIPNSLLCCELYEEWLDALEEDDEEEEQVHDVQRILLRLPKENTMLLRHLLAVLHGIQTNASENQMTSLNLSICIAPSLLWPPGAAHNPEVEGEGTRKICELVKFMIEHCQGIFGEDPCSMFGGPPQRQTTEEEETESWQYPLTDSSYDSLENELDNSSGGSPSFVQRKVDNHHDNHHQPLQGSLDSILTYSDYDQENDSENPSKTATRHYRIEKLGGDSVIYSSKQDYKYVESSPSLGSPSLEARQRPRRRSEPAVTYVRKLQPYNPNTDDDEQPNSQSDLRDESKRRDLGFGMKFLALEASLSSLASAPNSPAANYSSVDSLDSFSFDKSHRQQVKACTTDEIPVSVISTPEENSAKSSPPKDLGTLKSCGNLHPNTWLKKDWRLTLSHKDHLRKEEKSPVTAEKFPVVAKGGQEKSRTKLAKAGQRGPKDPAPETPVQSSPSPSLFYRQGGPTLSLFKKQRSTEEQGKFRQDFSLTVSNPRLSQRRGSEPSRVLVDRVSNLSRTRLPSDPGLKVSEVDGKEVSAETRFCLSPHATKAVKDYFSSHPRSNPQSSKQVALALVESQREWIKRCSDPQSEPDFEQLLLSEESYV
ncbi:hypothetical protein NL108_016703 [Boleophthalmus pectinirostris]|nr:hypothetical protein NL108_016703 [Boleophthalmus pectinirostris]